MELFGTAGIRGDVGEKVTPELALAVGRAVGRDAAGESADASGESVVVGRDGRTTGEGLAAAVTAGLTSGGADVVRVGQVPTPALAHASRGRRGVMLTASHNPPHDNGIKLFVDGEEYDDEGEARIERQISDGTDPVAWDEWGTSERADALPDYRAAVASFARDHGAPLGGLPVAVDCGNGMAGVATPQVLRELGADVTAINANVDGHFPGRESKPTAESLRDLRAYVADDGNERNPAFGIGHDGDADRIVVVDGDGEVVHEDTIVAILAEHYVEASDAGDPVVVTTPNASARIDERVRTAGGRVERVRLGALHVGIAGARAAGDADTEVVFAAEPWKHVHTQFGGWIDGVASAAVLARLVAESGLAGLREPVTERPYRKVSVDCPDRLKVAAMERLAGTLPDRYPEASVDTEYGVRLEFPDGSWTLVRPSGTEPYVRVYAESEAVDDLTDGVSETVRGAVEHVE